MKQLHVNRINKKREYEHDEVHYISFPEYHDKGWYRMMTSYSAFFEAYKNGNRNENENYLYFEYRGHDDFRTSSELEYNKERDSKLPHFYHDSLYDFFDHIGYCRKKKRILI
jgi:hypothetical protein